MSTGKWTKERESDVRKSCAAGLYYNNDTIGLLLAALDAERAAHEETRRNEREDRNALLRVVEHIAARVGMDPEGLWEDPSSIEHGLASVRAVAEGEVAGEYFHAIEEALRANACDEMPGPANGSESGSPEHAAQLVTWAIDHSRSVILAALRSERDKSAASICDTWEMAQRAEQAERDLGTCETVLAHVRAALAGAENDVRTARALAESRLRDIDTVCADRAAWTERAEEAEAALADVRQRCGGYPDSRVDGDGGIVAVVVRERDDARRSITCARYCLENDHGEAAVRACLDGMGMAPGIAEEYQSDLDRVTLERNAAVAEKDRADAAVCRAMTERDEAQADLSKVRVTRDACLATAEEATRQTEEAIRQRDEAQAALVGLREACRKPLRVLDKLDVEEWADFDDTLAATPATLAGQVRARVLREAADLVDSYARSSAKDRNGMPLQTWLRALADEAAKEGGR